MPELSLLLLAAPAILFAGIAKGGFANGPTFAATPLLALVLPPAEAVALMLPMLMVMDVTALRAWWRHWDMGLARAMVIGALPGIALGALLFGSLPAAPVQGAIGALALVFVAYQTARTLRWIEVPQVGRSSAPLWGGILGFSSFVTHAGGPPAAIYLLSRGLDKRTFQSTSVVIFAAVNAIKFVVYLALGLFTAETTVSVVLLAPVAIVGTLIGVWAHAHISERAFFLFAHIMLALAGAKLLHTALVGG
ncbi:MAG: sulfite exporter TauE/SafE family protein [Pseudomonadota bacterium]